MSVTPEGRSALVLVEVSALVRMTAVDLLSDQGYQVIEARRGDEALGLLDRDHDVRAIFTDVDLPGPFDGFALARIVDMRWPGIGIVATSDQVLPGSGDLPTKARFIRKPYAGFTLLRAIEAVLGPSGSEGRKADGRLQSWGPIP
jgi:CheY-like chemotaxis protein